MTDTKEERARALDSLHTLCDFFQNRVEKGPQDEALREFDKSTKKWISYTYQEVANKVKEWQRAFAASQINPGSRVAMLLPNGVDAVCFDQAAMANGLIPVPLHAIDTPASSAFILQDSEASFLITNRLEKWEQIQKAGFDLSKLKKVIITQEETLSKVDIVQTLKDWLNSVTGKEILPPAPTEHDLACIVYTSGTTGKPKGVMLSHKNIASNVRSTLAHVRPEIGAKFLSFLPLSHMFERTAGYYLALATGSTIIFNRSLQYLADDFKIAKPDVLISVPRVYERIYGKLQEALKKKGPIAQKLFSWGVNVGWRDFCRKNKIPYEGGFSTIFDKNLGKVFQKRISKTLQDQFGGQLKVAISGGASLNEKVAKVFCGLGLPVIQGYGMTETSPIICGNKVEDNDPNTVGRLLKDVQVKIGEQDEILVKGDLVMQGYWNRAKDTKLALTEDGWLHTGDQGEFDSEGRLRIKGRIKEILVTSTGEKISPVDIESAIECDPLINQCFAVGDGRPYIATLLSLDKDKWVELAEKIGVDPTNNESLQSHEVKGYILKQVKKLCKAFPAYAVPKNVALTLEPWTIEKELLTPTLKLKRKNMMAKYGTVIESMYKGARR